MNTKRSEVARQEGDIFLVAITGKGLNIGDPDICFGQTDCGLSFLHLGTSRKDFRVCRKGSSHAIFVLASFLKVGNTWIKIQSGSQWQANQVIEFQFQICQLEVGRQQVLLSLQLLGSAVDLVLLQRAAEFYLLEALALERFGGLYSRFSGATVRLCNEYLVVDLMNTEGYVVSSELRLLTRCFQLGLGHLVFALDLEKRRQRLGNLCSTGCDVFTALVDDRIHRRNLRSSHGSQTSSLDLYQLCFRQMHKVAVIPYRWKILALRDLLHVLFFLDRIAGDADIVVVLERQLNRFGQCNPARRRRRIGSFLGRNANGKSRRCHHE